MLKVSDRDVEHLDSARASCTLKTDALLRRKVIPSHCLVPCSVTPVVVLHNHGRILDHLATEEAILAVEMQLDQGARIEQPVVMGR